MITRVDIQEAFVSWSHARDGQAHSFVQVSLADETATVVLTELASNTIKVHHAVLHDVAGAATEILKQECLRNTDPNDITWVVRTGEFSYHGSEYVGAPEAWTLVKLIWNRRWYTEEDGHRGRSRLDYAALKAVVDPRIREQSVHVTLRRFFGFHNW